jgi:hypothetical protein
MTSQWTKRRSSCNCICGLKLRANVSTLLRAVVGKIYDAIELNVAAYNDPNEEHFSSSDEDDKQPSASPNPALAFPAGFQPGYVPPFLLASQPDEQDQDQENEEEDEEEDEEMLARLEGKQPK